MKAGEESAAKKNPTQPSAKSTQREREQAVYMEPMRREVDKNKKKMIPKAKKQKKKREKENCRFLTKKIVRICRRGTKKAAKRLDDFKTMVLIHFGPNDGVLHEKIILHHFLNDLKSVTDLLLADRFWYGRFTGKELPFNGLDQELEGDRKKLKILMLESAKRWAEYVSEADTELLHPFTGFTYTDTSGVTVTGQRGPLLDHMFNHATAHRAQIAVALTSQGYRPPILDLLYYLRPDVDPMITPSQLYSG